jgi:hypothetical protein
MTSPLDSGNVGRLRKRFSPELLAFPSPDSDNHHEAASPKMALSPIGVPTRPKCPETAALRSLCSLRRTIVADDDLVDFLAGLNRWERIELADNLHVTAFVTDYMISEAREYIAHLEVTP